MVNIWYHGTTESSAINICSEGIDFSKSNKELDFGMGFYLTDDIVVATKRALKKTQAYNRVHKANEKPALVRVSVDDSCFTKFHIKEFRFCDDKWLHFIIANRLSRECLLNNKIEDHNLDSTYDVVIGSIADSNVSEIANHINNGDMSLNDVSVYDVLTDDGTTLGQQMSLHTKNSLQCIVNKEYEMVERRSCL